jgi:hypothetical protein
MIEEDGWDGWRRKTVCEWTCEGHRVHKIHMQVRVEGHCKEINCEQKSEGQEDSEECVFDEHEIQEELKQL